MMVDRSRPGGGALFVSYDGLLEDLGRSQVLPYVKGLRARGYPMGILSFEKPADLEAPDRVEALEDELTDAGVSWQRLKYHRTPSLAATAYDVLKGASVIRSRQPALVHARSYVPGTMALNARAGSGAKVLFDMRGFWVDERIESGIWPKDDMRVQVARRAEGSLLTGADHLVHLTASAAGAASALVPGDRLPPHDVIPTAVDLDRFAVPADRTALRRALGLDGPGPWLVHSGTLGKRYMDDWTVSVARAWEEQTGGSVLILTGEVDQVSRKCADAGVSAWVRRVPHGDMPRWLGAADAGLALMRVGFASRASAPTKVGEYLACGLAVAATPVGDLQSQFDGAECCFVAAPGTDPVVVATRLEACVSRAERQDETRALAERHYALDEALDTYAAIYERLGVVPCA